jgi:hypothetical protein
MAGYPCPRLGGKMNNPIEELVSLYSGELQVVIELAFGS